MDFSEPGEDFYVLEAGLFADFADGGLASSFAGFDMAFRNSPAVFRVLDEENLDVFLIAGEAKNDATGSRFADDFLDRRLTMEF